MQTGKLNPKWLYAAVVRDTAGNRVGTVAKVDGDKVTVMCKGVAVVMRAAELDKAGLLSKANALHPKYLKA